MNDEDRETLPVKTEFVSCNGVGPGVDSFYDHVSIKRLVQ